MKLAIIIVLIVIVIIVSFLGYFGMFSSVNIVEKEYGGYTLVYEDYVGDYKNSGRVMNEVYFSLLNTEKIETYKGFGIYYDNPKEVEKEKLRSRVGCIIEKDDEDKVAQLKEKYKITQHPVKKCLVVEFPYKGKLSIVFGIIKVYPKINKYFKEKGYEQAPVMEVYDIPGKRLYYSMGIE